MTLAFACGCSDDPGRIDDLGRLGAGRVERPLRPGAGADVSAHIEPVYCSASLRCQDPGDAQAPGVRLVTGLSCAFDGGESAPPRDTLIAVQRRVRCYYEGDPDDPTSWVPATGVPMTPDDEGAFSAITNAFGDAFSNTSSRIAPWVGYTFCRYEALGTIASSSDTGPLRAARHTSGGVVARWEAVIARRIDATWACHGEASIGYAPAVVQSLPTPAARGELPATHDALVLMEAELDSADPGQPFGVVHGIGLAFGLGVLFPSNSEAVSTLVERRIPVIASADDGALDVRIVGSCIERDGAGRLAALLVDLEDRWTGEPVGAVRIDADHDGTPFDCARDPVTAGCALIPPELVASDAPCLVATTP